MKWWEDLDYTGQRLVYLEILLCLGWEAADNVCDNGDPGHAGLQVVHHLLKLGTRHFNQNINLLRKSPIFCHMFETFELKFSREWKKVLCIEQKKEKN